MIHQYINDNGEYYDGQSVVIDGMRYLSPSEELIIYAGYHKVEEPQPSALELVKSAKINDIETYDQSDDVNLFYLGGMPMWLDAPTRQQLRISIEAYQATGAENVTKWFNGEEFTYPISLWLQMLNALEVYAAEALNVTESHKSAINSLETIEEIEQFDITQGYPEKLNLMPR